MALKSPKLQGRVEYEGKRFSKSSISNPGLTQQGKKGAEEVVDVVDS
jgi:hypothetical protein